jgi:predicted nucleic acid-binding protein
MADKLVIDASVAAKWFLDDESDVDLAEEILLAFLAGTLELHAPHNFTYEVCGLVSKASRRRPQRISKDDAIEAVRKLFQLAIKITDTTEQECITVMGVSADFSKTFYDMLYLNLAELLDCEWCTADDKVGQSSPATFPAKRVLLLSSRRTLP